MVEIQDGRYSSGLYKKKNVWMPMYIHNTKKACFVRLRGCPYAPIHLDAPCMFDVLMFGWLPVSLDVPHMPPCMFGHPHTFGCPLCLDAPCMVVHPICLMPPICLDGGKFPQNSKEYFEKWIKYLKLKKKLLEIQDGSYTYWGIQTYRGHPNMKGASKHIGCVQTYGGIKTYGGIQTYRKVSKHMGGIQTYRGPSKHMWASKHMGMHPNILGHPNIWGHQNIQGASKHCSRLKSVASSATHMGATKHIGGIQIYG